MTRAAVAVVRALHDCRAMRRSVLVIVWLVAACGSGEAGDPGRDRADETDGLPAFSELEEARRQVIIDTLSRDLPGYTDAVHAAFRDIHTNLTGEPALDARLDELPLADGVTITEIFDRHAPTHIETEFSRDRPSQPYYQLLSNLGSLGETVFWLDQLAAGETPEEFLLPELDPHIEVLDDSDEGTMIILRRAGRDTCALDIQLDHTIEDDEPALAELCD